ncbi:50S ribosomal protein L22 [Candidatus Peregrinibacteria bacterium CG11_big_fil_rev_8_21_14_0_20_41_10]|nr:MAG: 50S ribosomal protein L22 [Candidatus Peregrinibacteria bacterium CG11_big_fil_rev_8_21_14_0_20_41_10]PIZ76763.1 MAG: 50S ribosomal protein L22 [Candidatus Peregrinibacteria bacterium CG_4_10_14_0_2_um_filter_41_8]PJC37966.1 MAG: 50S ribosomal protein L22 [Candidatus Peregrinibacteria bacterium CG_4_9_14_0_2_um_filter_41_14]
MKARLSNARISPKKMNLVAGLIRRADVNKAAQLLKFTNKKAAGILLKLLESAIANAVNNFDQKRDELIIDEIKVTKGSTYTRAMPASRGRSNPIKKVNSHVTFFLKAQTVVKKAAKKTAEKAAVTQ